MARRSQARLFNSQSFSIEFDSNIKEKLEKFAGDFVNEALRPAAYAGVTVLYDEMRIRVPVDEGLLKSAIYRWREKDNIGEQAIFYAGVNKQKAPHWWWIENGHFQYHQVVKLENGDFITLKNKPLPQPKYIPAKPYIRPTADAKLGEAMNVAINTLRERLNGIIKGSNATITDFN